MSDITKLEAKLRSCKLSIDGIPLELQLQPITEVKSTDDQVAIGGDGAKTVKKSEISSLTKLTRAKPPSKRCERERVSRRGTKEAN